MTVNRNGKGITWPSEKRTFRDRISGAAVTQLTDYRSHSFHLYFTNNGFYGEGRLLFGSDRSGVTNLFSLDLHSGQITQLTDLEKGKPSNIQGAFVHPSGHEAYFISGDSIIGIDLQTLEERAVYTAPAGTGLEASAVRLTDSGSVSG